MPATASEKLRANQAKKSSQFIALLIQTEQAEKLRNWTSLAFFAAASALWLAGLCRLNKIGSGTPWYLTVGLAVSAYLLASKKQAKLDFLKGLPKTKEPLSLKESLSICFMTAAVLLYVWIGFSLLQAPQKPKRLLQLVDIQLLSEHDFVNHNSPLPSTKPKEDLRKRSADQLSLQGSLIEQRTAQTQMQKPQNQKTETAEKELQQQEKPEKPNDRASKKQKPNEQAATELRPRLNEPAATELKPKQTESGKQALKTTLKKLPEKGSKAQTSSSAPSSESAEVAPKTATPLAIPKGWQTKVVDKAALNFIAAKSSLQATGQAAMPFISEVSAPELVELMDNDGQPNAVDIFQEGGSSKGGKGTENGLSTYLKELHKRIKSSWSPPPGSTRAVQLQFRLKKDGHLASCRIARSSGEQETDRSAIDAVARAAGKGAQPLPADYKHPYLDLLYTFNYNVNELEEVPANPVY